MYAMGYTEGKVVKFQYNTTLWIWAGHNYQFFCGSRFDWATYVRFQVISFDNKPLRTGFNPLNKYW